MKKQDRRDFFKVAGTGTVVAALSPIGALAAPHSLKEKGRSSFPELGLASYTTRKLSLDETIKWAAQLGLKHVALKDFHLPMDATPKQFADVRNKMREGGLDFYGVGVVYMKSKEEVDKAFEYARNAGVRIIIGVPAHELVKYTEKKIKEYDIMVAVHNHGPGDKLYPTCASVIEKIEGLDSRFGLCMDIGHTYRIGEDPHSVMRKFSGRIHDIHIKDVSSRGKKGGTVEAGRGEIDIPLFLKAVRDVGYKGYLSFEYEKDADSPIAGLAESVGYTRGICDVV